jgi:hypothetical protein
MVSYKSYASLIQVSYKYFTRLFTYLAQVSHIHDSMVMDHGYELLNVSCAYVLKSSDVILLKTFKI